jgi:hypothetical protein
MMGTLPLPMVFAAREPPMWLGGSIGSVIPMAGYAYAMMAEGLAPFDLLADEELGTVKVAVIKDGKAVPLDVDAAMTVFGDVRLRVPVPREYQDGHVALSLSRFLSRGIVKTLMVQRGGDIGSAIVAGDMEPVPLGEVKGLRALVEEHYFRANGSDPYLLVPVARRDEAIAVLTIMIGPLFSGGDDGRGVQPSQEPELRSIEQQVAFNGAG